LLAEVTYEFCLLLLIKEDVKLHDMIYFHLYQLSIWFFFSKNFHFVSLSKIIGIDHDICLSKESKETVLNSASKECIIYLTKSQEKT